MSRARSVLVVEDEAPLRQLLGELFREWNITGYFAKDGVEALAILSETAVSAILLDMRMPEMDGWQFAAHYRRRIDCSAPIIVFTAATDPEARAREIGADAWIAKPFNLADLADLLETAIGGHSSVSSASAVTKIQ